MAWKTSITNQTGNRVWVKAVEVDALRQPTGNETGTATHDIQDGDVDYLVERLKALIDELGAPTLDEQYETELDAIDAALALALVMPPTP